MTEDPFDAFVRSLDLGAPPPLAPLLRAAWYGLHGDWELAHELAQAQDDRGGARVHAWLHRVEGDLTNANYWYRRAGTEPCERDTRTEGLEIVRELLAGAGG
jgi:hypothetical protein